MRVTALRAAVGRLAIMVASVALGACDQSIMSPVVQPNVSSRALADVVPTADADSTRVTFTIARDESYYYESTGYVQVHGTLTCSRALGEQFDLFVKVEQKRPAKGVAMAYVRKPVTCSTTTAQPWMAAIPPLGGNALDAGRALVTVSNAFQTGPMVPTTASAYVRLILSEAF